MALRWRIWAGEVVLLAVFLSACSARTLLQAAPDEYEGSPLGEPAPDFALVDQNGQRVALSDFHGQVVVLTFMDSKCEEVYPLTAAHLRGAYQTLGDEAESVIFLGVNANAEANKVAEVAAASEKWQLNEIANWHFLTGSPAELESVWNAYNVAVVPPTEEGEELLHTSGVFVIDPAGQKRWYISTPFDESGTPVATAPLSELLVKQIRGVLAE